MRNAPNLTLRYRLEQMASRLERDALVIREAIAVIEKAELLDPDMVAHVGPPGDVEIPSFLRRLAL